MTRRRSAPTAAGAALLAVLLAWLVGWPLVLTLVAALGGSGAWTARHLAAFAARPDEWLALWRSLWISAASVALAAAVGVPLAFAFERADFPGRRLLGAAAALPVALPPLVGVIAFLFLVGESGFATRAVQAALGLDAPPWRLVGPGAILLVHAYSMYVYFYLFTRAALARSDGALLEAAASLGAGRLRTLLRVTLPLLRPALVAAALLTFMTSLASFSAPYLFGGAFRVMTTQITASKLNGDDAMAQVETVALAAVALAGLWGMRRAERAERSLAAGTRGVPPPRRRLRGAARWAAGAAAIAGAVFLLLPHAVLVLLSLVPPFTWTAEPFPPVLSLANWRELLTPEAPFAPVRRAATGIFTALHFAWETGEFRVVIDQGRDLLTKAGHFATSFERLRPVANSLWMAAAATAAAVLLGLAAALAARRRRGRLGGWLEGLLAVPWALPGTVFAVALAVAMSVDRPWQGRFLLIGTPAILPLAYLVRSLPLTGRAALAGLRQLDPALEEAAASLGAGTFRRLVRITLPLVRPALAAGAALAFVTALGDFVVSIVLYTFETRPISIEILGGLRLQELGLAAAYGVLLMAASAAAFAVSGGGREGRRAQGPGAVPPTPGAAAP